VNIPSYSYLIRASSAHGSISCSVHATVVHIYCRALCPSSLGPVLTSLPRVVPTVSSACCWTAIVRAFNSGTIATCVAGERRCAFSGLLYHLCGGSKPRGPASWRLHATTLAAGAFPRRGVSCARPTHELVACGDKCTASNHRYLVPLGHKGYHTNWYASGEQPDHFYLRHFK